MRPPWLDVWPYGTRIAELSNAVPDRIGMRVWLDSCLVAARADSARAALQVEVDEASTLIHKA